MGKSREPETQGRERRRHEHASPKMKRQSFRCAEALDTECLRAQHRTSHLGWREAGQLTRLSEWTGAGREPGGLRSLQPVCGCSTWLCFLSGTGDHGRNLSHFPVLGFRLTTGHGQEPCPAWLRDHIRNHLLLWPICFMPCGFYGTQ